MVAALCELVPQLVQTEAARACSAVLLSIDDSDPVVLPPLWEAVLHIISSIEVRPFGAVFVKFLFISTCKQIPEWLALKSELFMFLSNLTKASVLVERLKILSV